MRPEHLIKTHYIAPQGFSSVIDFLAKKKNNLNSIKNGDKNHDKNDDKENKFVFDVNLDSIDIKYNQELNRYTYNARGVKNSNSNNENNSKNNSNDSNIIEECFDTIILTIPSPQLLNLKGDIVNTFGNKFTSQLKNVVYSSR